MPKKMENVYVVACGRSAVAKSGKKGALRELHPVEMGGIVLEGLLSRHPELPREAIEDVVIGCAFPERVQGFNLARLVAARAGLSHDVCAMTINRFCSSGLQAVDIAAAMIESGQNDLMVAGGVESMTAIGINMDPASASKWILEHDPGHYVSMGVTAENVAAEYGVTRREMEEMAVESHRRAAAAQDTGKYDHEIIPLPGLDPEGGAIVFDRDQGVRRETTPESLAGLKPCFQENGVVTAATASQTSDGAAFLVLASGEKVTELGLKPIAKFIGFAVGGCDPAYMGVGPIYAVPKALALTGLSMEDMDVVELNEAFAAQAIPCIRELGMDLRKVNPNGGAMALGHPLGATGAVLSCKALSELGRTGGRYAMVTMCIGGGMGAAGIYEMV